MRLCACFLLAGAGAERAFQAILVDVTRVSLRIFLMFVPAWYFDMEVFRWAGPVVHNRTIRATHCGDIGAAHSADRAGQRGRVAC